MPDNNDYTLDTAAENLRTAAMKAASKNDPDIFRTKLREIPEDMHIPAMLSPDESGWTAVTYAVKNKEVLDDVLSCIPKEQHAEMLSAPTIHGITPLMYSVTSGAESFKTSIEAFPEEGRMAALTRENDRGDSAIGRTIPNDGCNDETCLRVAFDALTDMEVKTLLNHSDENGVTISEKIDNGRKDVAIAALAPRMIENFLKHSDQYSEMASPMKKFLHQKAGDTGSPAFTELVASSKPTQSFIEKYKTESEKPQQTSCVIL